MTGLALLLALVTTPAPHTATPAVSTAADGEALYAKKCDVCHGDDGRANTKFGKKYDIADFTEDAWRAQWPLERIIGIVRDGKADTKMKAFEDKLSAAEIEAVSKYVRSLGR